MKPTIYDSEYVDELVENDEISSEEAGFMLHYDTDDFESIV